MGVPSPGFSGSPSFPIIGPAIFFSMLLVGLLFPVLEILCGPRKWRSVGVVLLVAVGFLAAVALAPGIGVAQFGFERPSESLPTAVE